MAEIHYYEVNLLWESATQGTLSSSAINSKIEVETPSEFSKGLKKRWTPEHLFIASVNSCLMSAFLLAANNSKLEFISFESTAVGKIEKLGGKKIISEIVIKPKLMIPVSQNETRAKRVLELSEKACIIGNSVNTSIKVEPIIMTG